MHRPERIPAPTHTTHRSTLHANRHAQMHGQTGVHWFHTYTFPYTFAGGAGEVEEDNPFADELVFKEAMLEFQKSLATEEEEED